MHAGHVQQYVRLSMSIVTQRVNLRPRLIFLALLAQMQLFISFFLPRPRKNIFRIMYLRTNNYPELL